MIAAAPAPAPADVVRYEPHERQLAVHEAAEPYLWACMGYGLGKTTLAVFEALQLACVTHPGFEGVVAAPTYGLLFQSFMTEWKRWVPAPWYRQSTHPGYGAFLDVHTDQGVSRVWLRSTVETRSVEGINAAWLVYDEASREGRIEPVRTLQARVRRGYPGRQRRQIIIGPPMTRSHWTAEMFGAGPDAKRTGDQRSWTDGRRRVVRGRTSENPHLPPDYERDLRSQPGASAAWCKQFLDAQMGAVEGAIYEAFDRDVHVVPAASLEGRAWRLVLAGMDWGWAKAGALVVGALDGRGDLYVIHEEYHARKNVDDTPSGWLPLTFRVCRRHRVRSLHCDPSRPGDIDATGAKLANVTLVYPGDNDVATGIRRIVARLEWAAERARVKRAGGAELVGGGALYVSDACVNTIAEMEGYVRAKERDGSFSEKPVKRNDHALDALRYLEMGTDE